MNVNWEGKDWKWLTCILVVIIIFIFTFRLGDNLEVINLFSFISSAVSIALALVAIFISLKQDSDNQFVSRKITEGITKIETKVDSMDNKINNLDPLTIKESVEKFKEEVVESGIKYFDSFESKLKDNKTDVKVHDNDPDVKDQNDEWMINWKTHFKDIVEVASSDLNAELTVANNKDEKEIPYRWDALDSYLKRVVGGIGEIEIGLTEEDVGRYEKQFKLESYYLDYASKKIRFVLERNNDTFHIGFSKVEDIRFSVLSSNKVKFWIYMENNPNWRFYLTTND